jgi:hypothetical protein
LSNVRAKRANIQQAVYQSRRVMRDSLPNIIAKLTRKSSEKFGAISDARKITAKSVKRNKNRIPPVQREHM